jgi:hypothetical protein
MPGTPFNIDDSDPDLDPERIMRRNTPMRDFVLLLDPGHDPPLPALYGLVVPSGPKMAAPASTLTRPVGIRSAMASPTTPASSLGPVSPLTARRTWRSVEPVHGMIYFAPEAAEAYRTLGLEAESGYFASRAAPMGAVSAETVIATFYNFHPRLVRSAIPTAWKAASPEAIVASRSEAADGALRRVLGDAVGSPELARAAGLARAAAELAADHVGGRPLFAGHAGLAWPETPHLVLWHAQACLREFRGDGHIAALVLAEIGPVEALIMHVASGEVPIGFLRSSRGWSDDEWDAGVERLRQRGLLEAGSELGLSPTGLELRQRVEDETDRLAVVPYQAIGEDGCSELRALARPFSRAIVDQGSFGVAARG